MIKSGCFRDDAGGDDRPGERSAADFVDAADEHEPALARRILEAVQAMQPAALAFVGVAALYAASASSGDSNEMRPKTPSLNALM